MAWYTAILNTLKAPLTILFYQKQRDKARKERDALERDVEDLTHLRNEEHHVQKAAKEQRDASQAYEAEFHDRKDSGDRPDRFGDQRVRKPPRDRES